MRRKGYQRGSLKPRKRKGKLYWFAQWREEGGKKTKELGLCSKVPRADAEALLASIVRTLNGEKGQTSVELFTFKSFVEKVYLPIYREKWKASTTETEEYRLRAHLVKSVGD